MTILFLIVQILRYSKKNYLGSKVLLPSNTFSLGVTSKCLKLISLCKQIFFCKIIELKRKSRITIILSLKNGVERFSVARNTWSNSGAYARLQTLKRGSSYFPLLTGYWVLNTGYWKLGSEYRLLGTGQRTLVTGYWELVPLGQCTSFYKMDRFSSN